MGYADKYLGIVDSLKELLTEADGLAEVQQIIFGEKERGLNFPCIFIIPGEDDDEDVAMPNTQEHHIPFVLVAILKDPDIEEGLQAVIRLGGAIIDAVKADNTIKDSCLYAEFGKFNPSYGKGNDGTILHWCSVNVTAVIQT